MVHEKILIHPTRLAPVCYMTKTFRKSLSLFFGIRRLRNGVLSWCLGRQCLETREAFHFTLVLDSGLLQATRPLKILCNSGGNALIPVANCYMCSYVATFNCCTYRFVCLFCFIDLFVCFFLHDSNRLQLLSPFDKWDGKDLEDMTILLKVRNVHNYFAS